MSLARAIETGDLSGLPSRRDEAWRWTDLKGLVRKLPGVSPAGRVRGAGPFAGVAGREVAVVNGRGETALSIADGDAAALLLRIVATEGAGAHAARLEIVVGADAQLSLLESYEGEAADYLSQFDLDVRLAKGAMLARIVLADDGVEAVNVSQATIVLSPQARLEQTVIALGATRQRLETHVAHRGGGAQARLDGLYRLAGRRHADITTVVRHEQPGGRTEQLVKGVVADQARGVFQGRITVERGADETEARMGHHALVLSDRAEVDAKPELEIFADDVVCAHGNTVGALDENALFYAAQRGIPADEARSMLIEAFLGEVVDRIGHDGAREAVRTFLARGAG